MAAAALDTYNVHTPLSFGVFVEKCWSVSVESCIEIT